MLPQQQEASTCCLPRNHTLQALAVLAPLPALLDQAAACFASISVMLATLQAGAWVPGGGGAGCGCGDGGGGGVVWESGGEGGEGGYTPTLGCPRPASHDARGDLA